MKRCLPALIFVMIIAPLLVYGCERKVSPAGKYLAESDKGGQTPSVVLNLEVNGQGSWAAEGENLSFKWDLEGEQIRLHTRSGGVITGELSGDILTVRLPGTAPFVFRRTGEK